jgi:homoserine O-acetyltransferase
MFFLRALRVLRGSLLLVLAATAQAAPYPEPVHGEAVFRDFRFTSGEVLPELKIHYFTLGKPERDAAGRVNNAVLLLHGTNGQGANFLTEGFAGELFGAGQPLDSSRWFLIVPDNVGHGGSSKPSDGLRAKFPRYGYHDMVAAQHRLLTEILGIDHLRLIVGTSMGGMHGWMWAEAYPEFMDAMLPLVCLPAQISGRNRMERRLIVDAIRKDPQWKGGEYETQPPSLETALKMILITGGSARQYYTEAPTLEATDRLLDQRVRARQQVTDTNDLLYAWEASWDYDPAPGLEGIRAAVIAVNFADDARNPPELGILEREIKRVARGHAVTLPANERTRGHVSFQDATLWKEYLVELLKRSAPKDSKEE